MGLGRLGDYIKRIERDVFLKTMRHKIPSLLRKQQIRLPRSTNIRDSISTVDKDGSSICRQRGIRLYRPRLVMPEICCQSHHTVSLRDSSRKIILQVPSGEISTPLETIGMAWALGPMNSPSKARMMGSIPEERITTGTLDFSVQS